MHVLPVERWLRARNNGTFVRGKTKVRQHSEALVLRPFAKRKLDPKSWE